MSTTTSTRISGLLKVLLPPFESTEQLQGRRGRRHWQVDQLGRAGDVDVVFGPCARKKSSRTSPSPMASGVNRKDVMYNDLHHHWPRPTIRPGVEGG